MNRKTIWRRLYEWDPVRLYHGPGKILDRSTYRGCFMSLVLSILIFILLWHFDNIFAWFQGIRGVSYEIDLAKQSWARVWAVIIGGGCILTAMVQIILIPINRRRAHESTKGQWYDRPVLTQEWPHPSRADHEHQDRAQAMLGSVHI